MKILVVCQHYWPENFRINDIVEGFIERGHEVDVLCGQPNYPTGEFFTGYDSHTVKEEMHGKVRVYRAFEVKRGSNTNIRIFLNYMTYPYASSARLKALKNNHYDRIFIYQLSPVMMAKAGLKLAKKRNIPCIMYILDIWPQNLYSVLDIKNKIVRKFMYAWSMSYYKKPDRIITVSEKMRQYFLEKLERDDDNITFIPQCPEKLYEENVYDQELSERFKDGVNIVFTGNISPAQDLETITCAAKMCMENGLKDVRFIIVGDGMSRDYFEKIVEEANVKEMFVFEGFHPITDIPKYTGIANALLGTLKADGLEDFSIPAKVMSYLAAGRPLLIGMDGEPEKIVNEAKCGYVSKPGDARGLFNNIKVLYELSAKERAKLGKNARDYQQAHFERNKNIDKMLEVISK